MDLPELRLSAFADSACRAFEQQFGERSPEQHMMKLVEELGELAAAINKFEPHEAVEYEAADVLLSLMAVCDSLDLDLEYATVKKMRLLPERWRNG